MNRRRIAAIFAAALLVLGYVTILYLARDYLLPSAPAGSVFSGAPDGSRLLFDYLTRLGAAPHILQTYDDLPPASTIVAIGPFPKHFTPAESVRLENWVDAGGRLVLVGSQVDEVGAPAAGSASDRGSSSPTYAAPIQPSPFADGVDRIRVGRGRVLADGPEWVAHFKDLRGQIVISRAVGRGEVVWLSDARPVTDAGIGDAANARFATLLVWRGRPIYFDEYHHGYVSGGGVWDRLTDGGRVAVLFLALAGIVALGAVARRLGPPIAEVRRAGVRSTEWLGPLAELYRKAGARPEAISSLAEGLRRSLVRRYGTLPAGLARHTAAARALTLADAVQASAKLPRTRFLTIARALTRARQEVERA